MMALQQAPSRTGGLDGAQVLELPYGNGAFVMTVVLPPHGTPVDDLVASLTPARWDALLGSLREGEIDVHLPRFRLEYEDYWNDVLTAMGMGIAFQDGRADFTRMSASGGLFVSFVKQNTFVVLKGATMPAVLVEVGFISNPQEEELLKTREHQERLAEALYRGVLRFKDVYEYQPRAESVSQGAHGPK